MGICRVSKPETEGRPWQRPTFQQDNGLLPPSLIHYGCKFLSLDRIEEAGAEYWWVPVF